MSTRTIENIVAGDERPAVRGQTFEKLAPTTGEVLSLAARFAPEDTPETDVKTRCCETEVKT